MDENKIVNVKALLYDADTDEVKRIISQTEEVGTNFQENIISYAGQHRMQLKNVYIDILN